MTLIQQHYRQDLAGYGRPSLSDNGFLGIDRESQTIFLETHSGRHSLEGFLQNRIDNPGDLSTGRLEAMGRTALKLAGSQLLTCPGINEGDP